jgi:hypothetical protein
LLLQDIVMELIHNEGRNSADEARTRANWCLLCTSQFSHDTPSPNHLTQIIELSAVHFLIYEAQGYLFPRCSRDICGEWVASSQPLDSSGPRLMLVLNTVHLLQPKSIGTSQALSKFMLLCSSGFIPMPM